MKILLHFAEESDYDESESETESDEDQNTNRFAYTDDNK